MRLAIQLAFVLLQRRCEVLGMAKSELDLSQGLWTIPADRMKGKRTHVVPLSPWAVELIEEAIAVAENRNSRFVFPGKNKPNQPMRGPSMNWAFNAVLWAVGAQDGTVHDIRRTGSTLMTSERLSVSPFIRSKVLAHYDTGGGAQVSATRYDANSYRARGELGGSWPCIVGLEPWHTCALAGDHRARSAPRSTPSTWTPCGVGTRLMVRPSAGGAWPNFSRAKCSRPSPSRRITQEEPPSSSK